MPSDKTIHGAAFANIVLRKVSQDALKSCYYVSAVDDKDSLYADKQFVSLNYVESTAVAINALDRDGYPILNPATAIKCLKDSIKDYPLKLSKKAPSETVRLDLIELHKERRDMSYETLLSDKESRVFEPAVLVFCDTHR